MELTFAELHQVMAYAELGVSQYWRQFNIMDCIKFISTSEEAATQAILTVAGRSCGLR